MHNAPNTLDTLGTHADRMHGRTEHGFARKNLRARACGRGIGTRDHGTCRHHWSVETCHVRMRVHGLARAAANGIYVHCMLRAKLCKTRGAFRVQRRPA